MQGVPLTDKVGNPADDAGHCPAAGLSRVRGDYWTEFHVLQALNRLIAANFSCKFAKSRGQRIIYSNFVGTKFRLPLPQHPNPVEFLGGVSEVEVAGEGICYLLSAHWAEGGNQRLGFLKRFITVLMVGCDCQCAEFLHVLQQFGAAVLKQYAA